MKGPTFLLKTDDQRSSTLGGFAKGFEHLDIINDCLARIFKEVMLSSRSGCRVGQR